MSTLLAHIQKRNAETQAWVDAAEGRWAGMIVEDLEHWAGYGVTTVAQYDRYMMETSIWDLYKDVNGIRPRWMDFSAMSDANLSAEYDSLLDQLEENNKRDAVEQAEAIVRFEQSIVDTIAMGAADRDTAIRWLRDAEQDEYMDDDYFCYHHGLPYGYFKQAA